VWSRHWMRSCRAIWIRWESRSVSIHTVFISFSDPFSIFAEFTSFGFLILIFHSPAEPILKQGDLYDLPHDVRHHQRAHRVLPHGLDHAVYQILKGWTAAFQTAGASVGNHPTRDRLDTRTLLILCPRRHPFRTAFRFPKPSSSSTSSSLPRFRSKATNHISLN
jgi:hypothetical protein